MLFKRYSSKGEGQMSSVKFPLQIVKRAKDASRAVKQINGVVMYRVEGSDLTKLLNLTHFVVEGVGIEATGEQEILHLRCRLGVEVAICPCCQAVSTDVKNTKERCIRDLDAWERRVFIHFAIRRFECPCCEHRFYERLQAVSPQRRQTIRFEEVVYKRCLDSSKKGVAQALYLGYSTVAGIFKRLAKRKQSSCRKGLVRILGMDEISLKKRHKQFALVLSDLERRHVIAVLPSREQSTIIEWFATLSEQQKKAIRVVSMDMWRPYRSFAEQFVPHARIVADRFHVMKQLNDQLTKARRQIQRSADDETKDALKGSRWLLVTNRDELSTEKQQQLLDVLSADPELRTAYLLKEEFRHIFEKIRDEQQARRFLEAWILKVQATHNKYLMHFIKTLRNWFDQILAYFDRRVSNGFVEGMNRAIRFIISRAFGFRSFDNFRLQVLAQHGPDS
jgi:transposase